MRVIACIQLLEIFAIDVDVFVAAAGEIDDEDLALGRRARAGWLRRRRARDSSAGMMPSVRAERQAASSASASLADDVFGAAAIVQPGVLRADRGVVEAGGNGVRERDLAVARPAAGSCRRRAARPATPPRKRAACSPSASPRPPASTPISCTRCVRDERMEDADGVAAAAHAGEDGIGQAAFGFENLRGALPRRSRCENRAPSSDTDASRAPSPAGSGCRRRW